MLSNVPILQEPPGSANGGTPAGGLEEEEEMGTGRNGGEAEFLRGMDDPVGRGLLMPEDVETLFNV